MKDLRIFVNRKVIAITGNSMGSTIPKNSSAILQKFKHDNNTFLDSAIYVLEREVKGLGSVQTIGAIHVLINGYRLVPANKDYESIEISREEMQNFKVLGRVVGYYKGWDEYSNVMTSKKNINASKEEQSKKKIYEELKHIESAYDKLVDKYNILKRNLDHSSQQNKKALELGEKLTSELFAAF